MSVQAKYKSMPFSELAFQAITRLFKFDKQDRSLGIEYTLTVDNVTENSATEAARKLLKEVLFVRNRVTLQVMKFFDCHLINDSTLI